MPVRRKNSVRSRTDPSFSEAFVTVRLVSHVMVQLAKPNLNDIRHAALAYTFVRKVCAHSVERQV